MSLHDTPVSSLGLVEENCVTANEPDSLVLTTEEVDRYDTKVLRRLAAASESDAIHGKSTVLEMRSFLTGQRTLQEYEL